MVKKNNVRDYMNSKENPAGDGRENEEEEEEDDDDGVNILVEDEDGACWLSSWELSTLCLRSRRELRLMAFGG